MMNINTCLFLKFIELQKFYFENNQFQKNSLRKKKTKKYLNKNQQSFYFEII